MMSMNTAMFNLSALNYICLSVLGVDRGHFFVGYAATVGLLLIGTFFLLPKHAVSGAEAEASRTSASSPSSPSGARPGAPSGGAEAELQAPVDDDSAARLQLLAAGGALDEWKAHPVDEPFLQPSAGEQAQQPAHKAAADDAAGTAGASVSLLQEVRSSKFVLTALFYSVALFQGSYLGAALPDVLDQKGSALVGHGYTRAEEERLVSLFSTVLLPALSSLPSLVFAPVAGLLVDKGHFASCFCLCAAMGQLVFVLASLESLYAQVGTILLGTAKNALLFTGFFAFLASEFSDRNYGKLVSCCTLVSSLLGTAVVPLIEYTDRQYSTIFFAMIAGASVCYMLPLSIVHHRAARRRRRRLGQ